MMFKIHEGMRTSECNIIIQLTYIVPVINHKLDDANSFKLSDDTFSWTADI